MQQCGTKETLSRHCSESPGIEFVPDCRLNWHPVFKAAFTVRTEAASQNPQISPRHDLNHLKRHFRAQAPDNQTAAGGLRRLQVTRVDICPLFVEWSVVFAGPVICALGFSRPECIPDTWTIDGIDRHIMHVYWDPQHTGKRKEVGAHVTID